MRLAVATGLQEENHLLALKRDDPGKKHHTLISRTVKRGEITIMLSEQPVDVRIVSGAWGDTRLDHEPAPFDG